MPKYKLLAGTHSEPGPKDANGQPTFVHYTPGDVFETNADLKAKYDNYHNRAPKFERVYNDAPVGRAETPEERLNRLEAELVEARKAVTSKPEPKGANVKPDVMPTLEAMSLKDLQAWAAGEEIDVKGAKTKEDVLKAIKVALG